MYDYLEGPYSSFEDDGGATISILRVCPKCMKFITKGKVFTNGLGEVKLENWICTTHKEVTPYFNRL